MQRLQRERRVAHPGVAVVPVALAAGRLGQRGRRRRDRRAGRHVRQALDRQRRALRSARGTGGRGAARRPATSARSAASPPCARVVVVDVGRIQLRRPGERTVRASRRRAAWDRHIQHVRLRGCDLGQHRAHVHIGWCDRLLRDDLAAQLDEVLRGNRDKLLGIGAAVMHGGKGARLQRRVDVLRVRRALIDIARDRAGEAIVGRLAVRRSERRRRTRIANVGNALLPQNRRGRCGRTGTGATQHDDGLRIGRELGRRGLATFRVASDRPRH